MAVPEIKPGPEESKPDSCYGVRHTQCLLLFFLVMIAYGIRSNLSVGIVAMTDPEGNPDFPIYDWHDTSTVLSSFFWGYITTQLLSGILAKKYGPKWFVAGAMAVNSLFCALIPPMATLGSYGVMICRILQGMSQGFFFPSLQHLLSYWVPNNERAKLGAFVFSGCALGTVVAMPVTGWIASTSAGWPTAFYLYGALGFIWIVFWIWLSANSPAQHKHISVAEKKYIESRLSSHIEGESTPWLKIFSSMPMWALITAHCAQNWGYFTLLTEIPSYMNEVLGFDIESNGVLSALPYFAQWIVGMLYGPFADYIINKQFVSRINGRRIANTLGLCGPALFLILLGLLVKSEDDRVAAIALLVSAVGINACQSSSINVNHIDLSPNHAGILMAITNMAANVMSIIGPLIVQIIVTEPHNVSQWGIIFYIASGVYVVGNTIYVIFASGDVQKWNSSGKTSTDLESQRGSSEDTKRKSGY